MAQNKVVCDGLTFTEEQIKSGSIFLSNSIAFDELGIDTLEMEMDLSEEVGTIFAPADADCLLTSDNRIFTVKPYFHILVTDPAHFSYGKRVDYYRDDTIFGSFYMHDIRRVSQYFFAVSCVSAVGLLETIQHYGGLYTGQTFEAVACGIIGKLVPYSVAGNVKNIKVFGWLPVATARDNLRQLLFASGVALRKGNDGNVSFELINSNVPFSIPDNRILLGGSVDYPAAASEAIVVEHSFFSTSLDETVTLYDGALNASTFVTPSGVSRNGILVTFDAPAYGLSATGATILESGVNYAVLSPGGYATLTGKKYTHTTREVLKTAAAEDSYMVGEKNVARVENATLVNATNSDAVVARVSSYYASARTIKSKIVVESERPGDNVTLKNPFREMDEGLIASMDINMSRNLVANIEVVADYEPVSGGTYENFVLLTGVGEYTTPPVKTKIHAVLVGAGTGGFSGLKGQPGKPSSQKSEFKTYWNSRSVYVETGEGGDGGLPGQGGPGGSIYQTTLEVTPGQKIQFSCGVGGPGGASNKDRATDTDYSAPGQRGGATTFGNLSSDMGTPSDYGYMDIFTGSIYGGRGDSGVPGGKGGGLKADVDMTESQQPGPDVVYNGVTYHGGENNLTVVSKEASVRVGYLDGNTNKPQNWSVTAAAMYGAGGGAAAGRNGNKATNTPNVYAAATVSSSGRTGLAMGGGGGQGSDAVPPGKETRYGFGGKGGNGGGGEGGGGVAEVATTLDGPHGTDPGTPSSLTVTQKTGSGRGLGSDGGTAADGCILIYY